VLFMERVFWLTLYQNGSEAYPCKNCANAPLEAHMEATPGTVLVLCKSLKTLESACQLPAEKLFDLQ
jgi:hypothetical protein